MGFKFVKEEVARVAGRDTMEVHVQRWKDARKETLQLRLSDCNEIRHVLRSQGWEWEPEGKYYWKNVGEPMHEEAFLTLSEAGIVIPSDEEEESAEGVEEEVRRPQRKRRRLNEDQDQDSESEQGEESEEQSEEGSDEEGSWEQDSEEEEPESSDYEDD